MHYILKLPGTIAQVVNYPTTWGPFLSANEASLQVVQTNNSSFHGRMAQNFGIPVPPTPDFLPLKDAA